MPDTEKLCIVDDTFFITGRGPVVVTSLWVGGELKVGDWVELRSADGKHNRAQIKSFELPPRNMKPVTTVGGFYNLLLMHIDRSLIHIGDEVWSVPDPPKEDSRKPWYLRLFF